MNAKDIKLSWCMSSVPPASLKSHPATALKNTMFQSFAFRLEASRNYLGTRLLGISGFRCPRARSGPVYFSVCLIPGSFETGGNPALSGLETGGKLEGFRALRGFETGGFRALRGVNLLGGGGGFPGFSG